jgi:hypothetical protein
MLDKTPSEGDLSSVFGDRVKNIRKNLPWIAAMGAIYGFACNINLLMEGPQSLIALKDGNVGSAISIADARVLSFIPLKGLTSLAISLEQAKKLQFRVTDAITRYFNGYEILSRGDLGGVLGLNMLTVTQKAEQVFADVFDAEAAALVRGSGTGAIRWAFLCFLPPASKLLVHKAPIYETTRVTLNSMGIVCVEANYNNLDELRGVIRENPDLGGALIQIGRQKIDDRYHHEEVISTIKSVRPSICIVADNNYAAMKIEKIGVQCGSDQIYLLFPVLNYKDQRVLVLFLVKRTHFKNPQTELFRRKSSARS